MFVAITIEYYKPKLAPISEKLWLISKSAEKITRFSGKVDGTPAEIPDHRGIRV